MRRIVAIAASAAAVVGGMPLTGLTGSAAGAGPAGALTTIFGQGADSRCSTAKYRPPADSPCPPAAMAMAVLPSGKVLFWDGLEGMSGVDYNVVAEFGDVAQNDQSRVLDLSGATPQFTKPGNQAADGNGTLGEGIDSPLPGAVDSPGNDYDLFCSPLIQLADGTVLAAGGTKYYLEPGVKSPVDGKGYGVSELQGLKATRLFDPSKNTWENLPGTSDMHFGRWYPTLVTLSSGKVFVASGVTKLIKPVYTDGRQQTDSGRNVVETETFNPATRQWTVNKGGASSDPTLSDASQQSLPLFARLHLLPDGKVYYDAGGQTFNPMGQGYDEATWVHAKVYDPAKQSWSDLTADNPLGLPLVDGLPLGFRGSGFDVMLPLQPDAHGNYTQARVLNGGGVVGVTPGSYLGDNSTTVNTIDTAHGDALSSKAGPTLLNRRWYGTGVVLPDGEVFVTNGADRDEVDVPGTGDPVYQTELISADLKTVSPGPSLDSGHGRTYHNTAVLLPDARVLIGGHAPIATGYAFQDDHAHQALGFSSTESDSTFQIYSPPYLSYGPRPTIEEAEQFTVANPDGTTQRYLKVESPQAGAVTKVVLVRNPSMTHLTDGDQRSVELTFTKTGDDSLVAQVPDATVVPSGPYMLFVETAAGGDPSKLVPSVSAPVVIPSAAAQPATAHQVPAVAVAHGQARVTSHPNGTRRGAVPQTSVVAVTHAVRVRAVAAAVAVRSHDRTRDWPVFAGAALVVGAGWWTRRRLLRR